MSEFKKTNNRLRKIRCIMKSNKIEPVYGVTIPTYIVNKWKETKFRIYESGTMIILESGAVPQAIKKGEIKSITTKLKTVII